MKKKRITRTIQIIVALLLLFSMFPIANFARAEDAITGSTAGGSKTVTDNGDGTYQVQLTLNGAYAEEQTVTPTDFIFVCDVSGSMDKSISSSDSTTRFTALINALNSAVDIIFKDEDTSTSGTQNQNRVSFITFSSNGNSYTDQQKVYPSVGNGYYSSLSDAQSAISTINKTGDNGGTNYCLGLDKAGQKAAESPVDRNVVMIFLTDGQVSNYSTLNYNPLSSSWYWGEGGTGQEDSANLADCISGTNKYVDGGKYTYTGIISGTHTTTWGGWNPTYSKYFDARYCVALGFDPASISSDLSACITNFCPDGIKKADSAEELESIFNTIATNPFPMKNVSIQDTLTSDVEFTTTDTDSFTVQIGNGSYDDNGNPVWDGTQISTVDQSLIKSISVNNGTVSLVMKQDSGNESGFTLLDSQRLILTFNIKPSDSVFTKAFEDPNTTTFNTNVTDTDVSNPSSSFGSGKWGDDNIYAVYPSGTITIPTTDLILNKLDQIGQSVGGAKFSVVRNGTNGDSKARTFTSSTNGTVTIDGLSQGTYTLKETSAPDGYTADSIEYTFTVSKGDDGSLQVSGLDGLTKTDSGYQVINQKTMTSAIIQKTVTGNAANLADTFTFTAKLLKADDSAYPIDYTGSAKIAGTEVTYKVTGEDGTLTFYNGDSEISPKISSAQEIEIGNIVTGAKLSVTESNRGTYSKTTVTGGTNSGIEFSSSNSEAPNTTIEDIQTPTTVVFTNDKTDDTPLSGFVSNNIPFISIASLAVLGIVYVVRKRS